MCQSMTPKHLKRKKKYFESGRKKNRQDFQYETNGFSKFHTFFCFSKGNNLKNCFLASSFV